MQEKCSVLDAVQVMYLSVNDSDSEVTQGKGAGSPPTLITIQALQRKEHQSAETLRQSRRLVLVFDHRAEGELGGQELEVETVEVPGPNVDNDPIPTELRLRAFRSSCVEGAFRATIRVSMQLILNRVEGHSEV